MTFKKEKVELTGKNCTLLQCQTYQCSAGTPSDLWFSVEQEAKMLIGFKFRFQKVLCMRNNFKAIIWVIVKSFISDITLAKVAKLSTKVKTHQIVPWTYRHDLH